MLRLPVAHCELNPIELAWASVKGYVAKHNKKHNLTEIEQLTPKGFEHITTDMGDSFVDTSLTSKINTLTERGCSGRSGN